ncbi:MAG: RNA 2',3'-cyclic phosphodiesterase [Candidatus Poribacteria bacterium]
MTQTQMRLFVAVMLPSGLQDGIRRVSRSWPNLREFKRARAAAEYHFTLKFLGDVEPSDASAVADALEPAFRDIEPCQVSLGQFGAFPTEDRAAVLWWGADVGGDGVTKCAACADDALEPLGFDRETRSFTPHITLSRIRPPAHLVSWLAKKNRPTGAGGTPANRFDPSFEVREVSLVRSELTRQGAHYHRVRSYALGGGLRRSHE